MPKPNHLHTPTNPSTPLEMDKLDRKALFKFVPSSSSLQ